MTWSEPQSAEVTVCLQTSPETTEFQHQKPDKLGADTWKWLSDNLAPIIHHVG